MKYEKGSAPNRESRKAKAAHRAEVHDPKDGHHARHQADTHREDVKMDVQEYNLLFDLLHHMLEPVACVATICQEIRFECEV